MTIRPRICPCSISLKITLISSSGRKATFGTTFPSAANWKASVRSSACPHQRTDNLNAIQHRARDIKVHGFWRQPDCHHAASGANGIYCGIKRRLSDRGNHRCVRATGFSCTILAASSVRELMVRSAPISSASFSCPSLTSMAITFALKTFFAYCKARLPRPPRP